MKETGQIRLEALKKQMLPVQYEQKSRDLSIELLKIMAAVLTVFYHFAYYRLDYGFYEGVQYLPNLNRIIMSFAACCVPIFFLVNGALMLDRERSWKSVYAKAAKVLCLTVLWMPMHFPSWFFKTLIILYLIFPILQYCRKEFRGLYCLIGVAVFLMPFCYNLLLLLLKWVGIERIGSLVMEQLHVTGLFTLYSILYFILGPVLYRKREMPRWIAGICMFVGWGVTVIECVVYTNLNQAVYDGVNASFPTIGALLLSIGVFSLICQLPLSRFKNPILWMGDAVLPVYLMHMAIISIVKGVFGSYHLNLLTAFAGTFGIYLLCALVGKIFRRIPVLCWLVKM